MARRPELMVVSGELSGSRFSVPKTGLRLGRSSSNDICIADEELSRNHCMFECDGEDGLCVVDLASANGTFVNGSQLGSEAHKLRVGDIIEVGATKVRVVGDAEPPAAVPPAAAVIKEAPAGVVDLGLGTSDAAQPQAAQPAAASGGAPGAALRRRVVNVIWVCVAALLVVSTVLLLTTPTERRAVEPRTAAADETASRQKALHSLAYEKVDADSSHVFRYCAEIGQDGVLHVVFDDLPGENRRMDREGRLSSWAKDELGRIFDSPEWLELEDAYSGPSASSENALRCWRLRIVRGGSVKEVRVENTLEPKGFQMVRERLETLVNNELGVQSIQRSRDELIKSSEHSEALGDEKWEERDVEYGNLCECISFYKSAKNDLSTIGSNTERLGILQRKIEKAEAELKKRYEEVRFEAERAKQIGDWERARSEFRKICDMIPDKGDPRHMEANAIMVDVESRIEAVKKGGKSK